MGTHLESLKSNLQRSELNYDKHHVKMEQILNTSPIDSERSTTPEANLSCLPSSSTSDNSQNQRSSLKHPQFSSTPSRPSRQNNAAQLQKDKKINTINPPLDLTSEDQVYEHIATINKNEIAKYKSVPAIRDRIQELQVELQKSKYSV